MKAIIVEDNPGAVSVLRSFLREYPDDVEICGVAQSVENARQIIRNEKPDIWLLDIRLQDKLVFSLFHEIGQHADAAAVIFLTAYYEPEYIHEALKVSAVDFIVKPIDRDKLFAALDKAQERLGSADLVSRIARLEEQVRHMDSRTINNRVPVHRVSGEIDYEDRHAILYIQTEDEVTRLALQDDRITSTTRPLKFYADLLAGDPTFLRISKQIILNLDFLKSFNPRTNQAILKDGSSVYVSRRKAARLVQMMSGRGD